MNNSKADMNILFLCGVFANENEAEVKINAKTSVEFSANLMQIKLIRAFNKIRGANNLRVISAPFIGAYPSYSRVVRFSGFEKSQNLCEYVRFNNIWGFRNVSRAYALKKAIRSFAAEKQKNKIIVVYSVHDPFLSAAAYAKKLDPSIKICLIAPDLPQYMNLETHRGILYDTFKKVDIASIEKHLKKVDMSVVLTEQMACVLGIDDRPYIVVEGIVDTAVSNVSNIECDAHDTIDIVYAGKLYERFGAKTLVDAFSKLNGEHYRLILCGTGDAVGYAKECAATDHRIILTGQISPDEVKRYLARATILVNPRPNNEDYTKYSFPSKNIEYLMTGKPVVAYMLDGMPGCYADFIYAIDQNIDPTDALVDALKRALTATDAETSERYSKFISYAKEHLSAQSVARRIISLAVGEEV